MLNLSPQSLPSFAMSALSKLESLPNEIQLLIWRHYFKQKYVRIRDPSSSSPATNYNPRWIRLLRISKTCMPIVMEAMLREVTIVATDGSLAPAQLTTAARCFVRKISINISIKTWRRPARTGMINPGIVTFIQSFPHAERVCLRLGTSEPLHIVDSNLQHIQQIVRGLPQNVRPSGIAASMMNRFYHMPGNQKTLKRVLDNAGPKIVFHGSIRVYICERQPTNDKYPFVRWQQRSEVTSPPASTALRLTSSSVLD